MKPALGSICRQFSWWSPTVINCAYHLNDPMLGSSSCQVELTIRMPKFAKGSRSLTAVCAVSLEPECGHISTDNVDGHT